MAAGHAVLVLALLAAPPPPPAAFEDPPPPAAEGPATAPPPPAPPAEEPAEIKALRQELAEAYLRVREDFLALTGERAGKTIAALAEAVEEAERTRGEAAEGAIPGLWMEKKLLCPEVAGRLAARRAEAVAKSAAEGSPLTVTASLAAAAKLVFPEATMEDNWDGHFLDLDVVRRWTAAQKGAAEAAPAEAPPGKPPERPPPPVIPDVSDMVLVPRGDLNVPEHRGRGWPNPEQKAERHNVRAFYIDRTEVPCATYGAFLREVKDAALRARILPTGWKHDEKGLPLVPEGAGALPVTGIPYEGAAAFAAAHGKRLPTEDEWERAARGDDGLRYPWGDEWAEGRAAVALKQGPVPVGSMPGDASPFVALDLCGNVSELCATFPDGKPVKGIPKAMDQVVRRGGNFRETADEAANDWRYVIGATARSPLVGFRCAMDERDYEKKFGRR